MATFNHSRLPFIRGAALSALACLGLAACASTPPAAPAAVSVPAPTRAEPDAFATLNRVGGGKVGSALFWDTAAGVDVQIKVQGVTAGPYVARILDGSSCAIEAPPGVDGQLGTVVVASSLTGEILFQSKAFSVAGLGGRPALLDRDGSVIELRSRSATGELVACGLIGAPK